MGQELPKDSLITPFAAAMQREKDSYAFQGKPLNWQLGFEKGFMEGWREKTCIAQYDPVTIKMQEVLHGPVQAKDTIGMLYEIWHKLPPCELLGVIGAAIQDLQAHRDQGSNSIENDRDLQLSKVIESEIKNNRDPAFHQIIL